MELLLNTDRTILITGGAGFIGSHVVEHFVVNYPEYRIINIDSLTYASDMSNINHLDTKRNYEFYKGDIRDTIFIKRLFETEKINGVIHLAAESHVDNSIENPMEFVDTNIIGTVNLLNECIKHNIDRFYHVSTDEVYGELGLDDDPFLETTPYDPKSPYSASKASSDHFVRAYGNTYKLPFVISNCSNNYGPHQHKEKLIPTVINKILNNEDIPIYGKGDNIRDWLYVKDHAQAIDVVYHLGLDGNTYNIGGNTEMTNIDIVKEICGQIENKRSEYNNVEKLITFVKDRAGHDFRYAIDCHKITNKLGWVPQTDFHTGISKTIDWYIDKYFGNTK
jgi:dTDP-glucose 4,6-dehydratase